MTTGTWLLESLYFRLRKSALSLHEGGKG